MRVACGSERAGGAMATQSFRLRMRMAAGLFILLALLVVTDASSDDTLHAVLKKREDASSDDTLHAVLKKREVVGDGSASPKDAVAVSPVKAKEFLAKLRRPKRNIWDRSRPDVQQWIQQFMYMGYDETRLEADLAYWMDHARSRDQGRQHHYDENAAMGPRDAAAHRHGANVNYDYY